MTDITVYIVRQPAGPPHYSFDPPAGHPPPRVSAQRVIPPGGWRWAGTGPWRLLETPDGELEGAFRALTLARRGLGGFRLAGPADPVAELDRRVPAPEGWDSDAGLTPADEGF